MLSGYLLANFSCTCCNIFTATGSLRLGTDSHCLTSQKTSLMRWDSRLRVPNYESSSFWHKELDEDALRQWFIVVDFMVELSVVLPYTRRST